MSSKAFSVSRPAKVFIGIVVLSALFYLIDQTVVSPPDSDDDESKWWLGIMFIQLSFFVYFAISAVLKENKWELYTFQAASFLGTVRVITTYSWRDDHCEDVGILPWCITVVVVAIIAQFLFVFFGYYIGKNMGWKFFKQVGSDAHLKSMWSTYQGFQAVLKVDVLLAVLQLFTVIFYSGSDTFSLGVGVGSAMLVVEVLWEYLGYWAVRRERKNAFIAFLVIGLLTPATSALFLNHFASSVSHGVNAESPFFKVLILLILVVLNRFALTGWGLMCLKNFDKGLRARMFERQPEDDKKTGSTYGHDREMPTSASRDASPSEIDNGSASDFEHSVSRSVAPSAISVSASVDSRSVSGSDFSLRSSAESFTASEAGSLPNDSRESVI